RLRQRDPGQAGVYDSWLTVLRRQYVDRLLPVTADVAEEWGRLNVPRVMPAVDGLMVATAKGHDMTFVTTNVDDVSAAGGRLLKPFGPVIPWSTSPSR